MRTLALGRHEGPLQRLHPGRRAARPHRRPARPPPLERVDWRTASPALRIRRVLHLALQAGAHEDLHGRAASGRGGEQGVAPRGGRWGHLGRLGAVDPRAREPPRLRSTRRRVVRLVLVALLAVVTLHDGALAPLPALPQDCPDVLVGVARGVASTRIARGRQSGGAGESVVVGSGVRIPRAPAAGGLPQKVKLAAGDRLPALIRGKDWLAPPLLSDGRGGEGHRSVREHNSSEIPRPIVQDHRVRLGRAKDGRTLLGWRWRWW